MKTINSREARANWRELLDEIQTDQQQIIIERYGKPIGVLVPYEQHQQGQAAPLLREPSVAYALSEATFDMNDKREQLLTQLRGMPDALLETAVSLLNLLRQAQQTPLAVVPVSAGEAAQWQGLLDVGYEGDAVADSEALYD